MTLGCLACARHNQHVWLWESFITGLGIGEVSMAGWDA